jgi:hypothetical protein
MMGTGRAMGILLMMGTRVLVGEIGRVWDGHEGEEKVVSARNDAGSRGEGRCRHSSRDFCIDSCSSP